MMLWETVVMPQITACPCCDIIEKKYNVSFREIITVHLWNWCHYPSSVHPRIWRFLPGPASWLSSTREGENVTQQQPAINLFLKPRMPWMESVESMITKEILSWSMRFEVFTFGDSAQLGGWDDSPGSTMSFSSTSTSCFRWNQPYNIFGANLFSWLDLNDQPYDDGIEMIQGGSVSAIEFTWFRWN